MKDQEIIDVNIKGGGLFLGGWTPILGPYVYHPRLEEVVLLTLRNLGLVFDKAKNHGGYSAGDVRRALDKLRSGDIEIELKLRNSVTGE